MQHKKPTGPTPNQNKMIQEAVALHQSGQIDAAETQYRKLLNFLPSNTPLASLLNAVNLPELITTTQAQYESLAIDLALHPEKLIALKENLANNLPIAALYDTPLFTKHLESAYLTMYDKYQKGLAAEHIYVEQ